MIYIVEKVTIKFKIKLKLICGLRVKHSTVKSLQTINNYRNETITAIRKEQKNEPLLAG